MLIRHGLESEIGILSRPTTGCTQSIQVVEGVVDDKEKQRASLGVTFMRAKVQGDFSGVGNFVTEER